MNLFIFLMPIKNHGYAVVKLEIKKEIALFLQVRTFVIVEGTLKTMRRY